jgi:hypothetical protein
MTDSNHNLKVNFKVKVFFMYCQIGGDAPNWDEVPVLNQVGRKDGDTLMKVFERLVTLMLARMFHKRSKLPPNRVAETPLSPEHAIYSY